MINYRVYDTVEEVSRILAEKIVKRLAKILQEKSQARFVVAGGSTFNRVYELFATEFKNSLEWNRVEIFFGDERCVHPDDSRSNFYQINSLWFSKILEQKPVVHRIKGELSPQQAVTEYGQYLPSTFDIVLLGIGDDGHTASLFPGSIRSIQAGELIVHIKAEKEPYVDRVSLTPAMLNCTDEVYILATGSSKKEIVKKVIEEDNQSFPISLIIARGDIVWYLDSVAASQLAVSEPS